MENAVSRVELVNEIAKTRIALGYAKKQLQCESYAELKEMCQIILRGINFLEEYA